jgi:hypothetical protein
MVNTSFMMGGAFGLAMLASLAAIRTEELQRSGAEPVAALNGGYHFAFLVSALLTTTAAVLGTIMLGLRPAAGQGTVDSQ